MIPSIRVDGRRRRVYIGGRLIPMTRSSSRNIYIDERTGIVVKLAAGSTSQCVQEAALWHEVRDTEWARYFAPVVAWSPTGTWIAQRLVVHNGRRTQRRLVEVERVARKFGVYDMHDGNWFVHDRCPVIVDYGVWDHDHRGKEVYL